MTLDPRQSEGEARMDPGPIMQLSTGYWESQAFLTANRIGLFEALSDGPLGVEQVSTTLATKPRPTRLLLNACVALGLVEEADGGYRNSPMSQAFLVPGTASYLGNAIRYADNLYQSWGSLEQALRDDGPALRPEVYLGQDEGQTRDFVYGMHNRAQGIARALVATVDLSGRRRMLDVGGGPGTYAALFTQRYPGLRADVLELPEVAAIAREILESLGVGDAIELIPADYRTADFPSDYDVVLISGVCHRESESACRQLIDKAAKSLVPSGLLVISDVFADEGGKSPLFATLFGLNMMLTATDGGVQSDAEMVDWARRAGFRDLEVRRLPPPLPHRVIIGTKM